MRRILGSNQPKTVRHKTLKIGGIVGGQWCGLEEGGGCDETVRQRARPPSGGIEERGPQGGGGGVQGQDVAENCLCVGFLGGRHGTAQKLGPGDRAHLQTLARS